MAKIRIKQYSILKCMFKFLFKTSGDRKSIGKATESNLIREEHAYLEAAYSCLEDNDIIFFEKHGHRQRVPLLSRINIICIKIYVIPTSREAICAGQDINR